MTREWKRGDVVHDPEYGKVGIVVPTHFSGCPESHERLSGGLHIHYADGDWNPGIRLDRCRPLLVLDPEDAEGVARLAEALRNVSGNLPIYADDVASALRSLLDPKPEEPKGLGAVVRDREGRIFVRQVDGWWRGEDPCSVNWPAVDVVEVLSHGVPEDGAR
jgi:hypothetical protein